MRLRRLMELLPPGSKLSIFHETKKNFWFGDLEVNGKIFKAATPDVSELGILMKILYDRYQSSLALQKQAK